MKRDTKQILQELAIHRLRELADEAGDSDIDVFLTVGNNRDIIIKVMRDRAVVCEEVDYRWHVIETIEL
jgi:hypothetical protein